MLEKIVVDLYCASAISEYFNAGVKDAYCFEGKRFSELKELAEHLELTRDLKPLAIVRPLAKEDEKCMKKLAQEHNAPFFKVYGKFGRREYLLGYLTYPQIESQFWNKKFWREK